MGRRSNQDALAPNATQLSEANRIGDCLGDAYINPGNGREMTQMGWQPMYFAGGVAELVGTTFVQFFSAFAVAASLYVSQSRECCQGGAVQAVIASLAWFVAAYVMRRYYAAHFNPAVTLVFWGLRKVMFTYALILWGAQFAGSVIAGALLQFVVAAFDPTLGTPQPIAGLSYGRVFFLEYFSMLFVVLFTLTKGRCRKTQAVAYGISIFVIKAATSFFTGASLTPFGYIGLNIFSNVWAAWPHYVFAPWLGAITGGLLYWIFMMPMKNDIRRYKQGQLEAARMAARTAA